ncbi:HAD-IA family hydrolase [Cohaesibacter haloalkalitolerans]|uniref:HAD-IA family hydrolase n=1 Tax=Cohaesibacter haloalkalitolerans TaxID=1162980 RepID=UPI000E650679|nr:HAD-IA family hydrolase [Cohaesibacter haloalkalitolerans]
MSLKLFIFDCDGTLVDSQHTIVEGMEHAFGVHRLPAPTAEETRSIIGLSLPEAIFKLAPHLTAAQNGALVESYKDFVIGKRARGEAEEYLYDGARDAIEALAKAPDVLLGIATGKAYRGVLHLFDCYGWHDLFVTVQTADRAPSKPHPGMILQAMGETGVAAADTYMIGDTSYDMEMAVSARVNTIGVSWGYHTSDALMQAGAQHIVDDYPELHALLAGL